MIFAPQNLVEHRLHFLCFLGGFLGLALATPSGGQKRAKTWSETKKYWEAVLSTLGMSFASTLGGSFGFVTDLKPSRKHFGASWRLLRSVCRCFRQTGRDVDGVKDRNGDIYNVLRHLMSTFAWIWLGSWNAAVSRAAKQTRNTVTCWSLSFIALAVMLISLLRFSDKIVSRWHLLSHALQERVCVMTFSLRHTIWFELQGRQQLAIPN